MMLTSAMVLSTLLELLELETQIEVARVLVNALILMFQMFPVGWKVPLD